MSTAYQRRPRPTALGKFLRQRRTGAGWTIPELAAWLGCRHCLVVFWETGRNRPNGLFTLRLCRVLRIDTGTMERLLAEGS